MGHADSKSGVATQFKCARTRLAAVIVARKSVQVVVSLGLAPMKSHLLLAIEVITANYACRIEYPALAHRALTLAMETCSRWKIPAAKAASMGAPWAPGRGANTSQK